MNRTPATFDTLLQKLLDTLLDRSREKTKLYALTDGEAATYRSLAQHIHNAHMGIIPTQRNGGGDLTAEGTITSEGFSSTSLERITTPVQSAETEHPAQRLEQWVASAGEEEKRDFRTEVCENEDCPYTYRTTLALLAEDEEDATTMRVTTIRGCADTIADSITTALDRYDEENRVILTLFWHLRDTSSTNSWTVKCLRQYCSALPLIGG